MKRVKLVLLAIIIFLCSFIINVDALEYKSDITSVNDSFPTYGFEGRNGIQFEKMKYDLSNNYVGFLGEVRNLNLFSINVNIYIEYYDSNKVLILTDNHEMTIGRLEKYYYNFHKEINSNIDIAYYSFSYRVNYDSDEVGYDQSNSYIDDNANYSSSNQSDSYRDYTINKYDINIKVNENNTFDIIENITAKFNVSYKHGIFRKLPLKNEVIRNDGSKSKNRAVVSKVSVNNQFTTSRENGNYIIKIGDADRTVTGEQKYVIKYNYNIGKDPNKDFDELYYNIIGNSWDTSIDGVTFTITMPKSFDAEKLGFSAGSSGKIGTNNVKYEVDGNVIKGRYDKVLEPGEGLTVRLELPEGYFVGAGYHYSLDIYLIFIIPLIFLAISISIWYKYGRDEKIVDTVEFYPPEGLNSLEVGFLYKGEIDNNDVVSLLVYLANKGYIKIVEFDEKDVFSSSDNFKIIKVKDYDGNNVNERTFLAGLFKSGNEVTSDDLYNNFYMTMDRIKNSVNSKENKSKIFEKMVPGRVVFIILMIIVTYCLITIPPVFIYGQPDTLIISLIGSGIGFTLMFSMMFGKTQTIYVNGRATHSPIFTKLFAFVWGGAFGGIPCATMILPALLQDLTYLILYIIGLGCVLGMVICINYLPKRTIYGSQMLGKLKGFKNFLETSEKDRLESLVMKNPTYFYDILPYTYVLGVSDKWIKKFEAISLSAPDWYGGASTFDMVTFSSFMSSTMSSVENAMSSSPFSSSDSDSFGSSSGGGGSSGGGSGGGGGGSW